MMLAGTWTLTRWINDEAPLSGTVAVSRLGRRRWLWQEQVRTPLQDGGMMEGVQAYEVVLEKGKARLYFASGLNKGGLFQELPLTRTSASSCHTCGADIYETQLEVLSRGEIRVTHHVKGPRKDYVMVSAYVRKQE